MSDNPYAHHFDNSVEGRALFDEIYNRETARRDRIRELWQKEPKDLTLAELVEIVRLKHTVQEIPPCRVCGGPLSIASVGGNEATKWACNGQEIDPDNPGMLRRQPGRGVADEHYRMSGWTQHYNGDSHVLELLDRLPKQE